MPVCPVLSQAAVQLRHRELGKDFEERKDELRLKEKKMLLEHERLLKELELRHASAPFRSDFDVARQIKLVPPFRERDVEWCFPHFEQNSDYNFVNEAILRACELVPEAYHQRFRI